MFMTQKDINKTQDIKEKLSCKASIFKNIFIIIFVGKHQEKCELKC